MLIMCIPYKMRSAVKDNKVLIADTDDLTAEYISETDFIKHVENFTSPYYKIFGRFIENIYTVVPPDCVDISAFDEVFYELGESKGLVELQGDSRWILSGVVVDIRHAFHELIINDVCVWSNDDIQFADVAYAFRYMKYIVLRLYITIAGTDGGCWASLVMDDGIVAFWTSDFSYVYGDKSIAIRIDTLSEV